MKFEGLKVFEDEERKLCRSSDYNFSFDKKTGFFARWGKTKDDDPVYAPSPEILDIEISTICNGVNGKPCPWCYKSNTGQGTNMNLETFKVVLKKINPLGILTQVALGIGDIDSNPDLFPIMKHCRESGVIPNLTINGWNLQDKCADELARLSGAVAVSHYYDDNVCFDAIKKLTDRGMEQINIHKLLSVETYESCFELIDKAKSDSRLEKLNAIVFLLLKPKGERNKLHSISGVEEYKRLIDYAFEKGVNFGFDSCSAGKFMKAVEGNKNEKMLKMMAEPCESFGFFSSYVSVDSTYYPCSFCENEGDWKDGFNMLEINDFIKDVWFSEKVNKWRKHTTELRKCGNFDCPFFNV
jgi:hypothetical protein